MALAALPATFRWRVSVPATLAALAALAAALPLGGVILAALFGETADIALRDILRYAATSAWLALLVGIVTGVVGSLTAWLVVMHRFPGHGIFTWALTLPLAAPAFALAYAYADLFDVAGPLRIWMRDAQTSTCRSACAARAAQCSCCPAPFIPMSISPCARPSSTSR